MKKILLLICFSFVFHSFLFATHNRGAEITYRHLEGYTYEIRIVTYTKLCSVCPDRVVIDAVHFGDDFIGPIPRFSYQDIVNGDIRVNIYIQNHTYDTAGIYRIYFADPNRNEGIVNMPNSVNVQMCVEAYLVAFNPATDCINNSAVFETFMVFPAQAGRPFNYNVTVTDPDHDSLSYELIVPLMSLDVPVAGYFIPSDFSLSSTSGQITWNNISTEGEYNFAVKVNEWRNNTVIGYVMREFQVAVDTSSVDTFNVFAPFALATDASGNYFVSINPGDTVNIHAVYYRDSIYNPPITAYGEAFQMSNPPTVQYSTGSGTAIADLSWIPDSSKIRLHPYVFSFRGRCSMLRQSDIAFLVYVNGTTADTCTNFTLPPEWIPLPFQDRDIHIYPNPMTDQLTVVLNRSLADSMNRIKIFDVRGRIVQTVDDVTAALITIHRSTMSKGLYFIVLENEEKIIVCKKIIIN